MLDGVATPLDAEGRFVVDGVAAGAHMIDIGTDGTYAETSVPIDVDVYPGARVVIALDPGHGPADPTTGGADDGASSGAGPGDDTTDPPGAEPADDGSGDAPDAPDGDTSGDGIPIDLDPVRPVAGCGCRSEVPPGWSATLLLLFGAARPRHRTIRQDPPTRAR
jgi:hypothetical protein